MHTSARSTIIFVMLAWYVMDKCEALQRQCTTSGYNILATIWLACRKQRRTNWFCAFMHIANYILWLKCALTGKAMVLHPSYWRLLLKMEIPSCLRMPWNFIQGNFFLRIGSWRGPSCLGTPNKKFMCLWELIVTHVNPTKWLTSFISLL